MTVKNEKQGIKLVVKMKKMLLNYEKLLIKV